MNGINKVAKSSGLLHLPNDAVSFVSSDDILTTGHCNTAISILEVFNNIHAKHITTVRDANENVKLQTYSWGYFFMIWLQH